MREGKPWAVEGPTTAGRGSRESEASGWWGSRVWKTRVLVVADALQLRDLERVIRLLRSATSEARINLAPHRTAVPISEVTRVRRDP